MKNEIRYIEKYTGSNHNGEAWIAHVRLSKTGKTIYFNGKAFKKFERGMYYDIENSDEYWITGIKKRGSNRHWAGSGKIMIEENALKEFMEIKGISKLIESEYSIVIIKETTDEDIQRLHQIENELLE